MCKAFHFRLYYVFLILLLFSVFSCTKPKTEKLETHNASNTHRTLLGFSQIGAESEWRIYNSVSMQDAAKKEGIQLLFSDAEQKQENQIKAIRSFIMYQVDAIVFIPIVQSGWETILQEAKDAEIPVIVCDRKISVQDDSLYAGYIGTDSTSEGRKAAEFLLKKYEGVQENINILEIRGTDGSSASDDRMKGFHDIMDKDQRFSVVYSESGDFMRSRGREIAENILKANNNMLLIDGKKIDAIFFANDGMMLGFLDILESAGIQTGKDITIVSVDGQQEAIDKLKEGKINCVVECNADLGPQVMTLVKKVMAGESIPHITHVQETVFTEYDDLTALGPRGY